MASLSVHQPFVFCPPLPGKPDPNEPSNSGKRVTQLPQKGDTCAYYALNMIRQRIGKKPTASQLEERATEKLFSDHRKETTALCKSLQWKQDFANQVASTLPSHLVTKKDALELLKRAADDIPEDHQEKCCAVLTSFCKQEHHKDLLSFVTEEYQEKDIQKYQQLLAHFNLPDNFVETLDKENWKTMSLFKKAWIYHNAVFTITYMQYHLNRSTWHPSHPIESLIREISEHGPHVVNGHIGQEFYKDKPFKLTEKVEGRTVFGWKPTAQRKSILPSFHVVVLVGARSEKGHVYFIDPLDGSDPKNIETQIIYVMSYERLKSVIANLNGMQMKTKQGKVIFDDPEEGENNYALHGKTIEVQHPMSSLPMPAVRDIEGLRIHDQSLFLKIFSYLHPKELAVAANVSRAWRELVSS